jgi:CheY-like chemotaxis protein
MVYNGQEAMDYLTRQNDYQDADSESAPFPDLIFLDINMPVMDGWDFLDAYQQTFGREDHPAVICILSTALPANVEQKLEDRGLAVGNFIEKPLRRDLILSFLHRVFPECIAVQ